MRTVIIDTNFLMLPSQFKIDIFTEINKLLFERYELCIVEGSIRELQDIAKSGKMVDRLAAKVALALVEKKNLKILSEEEPKVDDEITRLSHSGVIVATNDMALKRRVISKGANIITLRQMKYLVLQ